MCELLLFYISLILFHSHSNHAYARFMAHYPFIQAHLLMFLEDHGHVYHCTLSLRCWWSKWKQEGVKTLKPRRWFERSKPPFERSNCLVVHQIFSSSKLANCVLSVLDVSWCYVFTYPVLVILFGSLISLKSMFAWSFHFVEPSKFCFQVRNNVQIMFSTSQN